MLGLICCVVGIDGSSCAVGIKTCSCRVGPKSGFCVDNSCSISSLVHSTVSCSFAVGLDMDLCNSYLL
jgi:hypothetical protein